MNSKMTKNSQPSTAEPKKAKAKTKTNKQKTRTGTVTEIEITWRVISGEGEGREWGEGYRE